MGGKPRSRDRKITAYAGTVMLVVLAACPALDLAAQNSATTPAAPSSSGQTSAAAERPALPRGKKLVLTDGSFQLVREFKIEGDRVRYYSLDSSQWEQIPVALVDWDATKKLEAEEAERDSTMLAKVHKQEINRQAVPLDIDASLEVAPGIFLPPGDHLFVYAGKAVLPLSQAETDSKLSKGRLLEEVMVPIPIIPTRHSISIQGAHARLRIADRHPEFYIRVSDGRQPELVLIRAKLHGTNRHVENLDQIFGMQDEKRDAVPMQRWDIAREVFRFTLGQELTPGEYAIAENVRDQGASLYVWDFGVDEDAGPTPPKPN